jgi:inorganic pyrophosphatase
VEFDVVIEIPKGTRNKYEMDHKTGQIRLDCRAIGKALEPGKEVEAAKRVGRQAADDEIEACRLRATREGWSG